MPQRNSHKLLQKDVYMCIYKYICVRVCVFITINFGQRFRKDSSRDKGKQRLSHKTLDSKRLKIIFLSSQGSRCGLCSLVTSLVHVPAGDWRPQPAPVPRPRVSDILSVAPGPFCCSLCATFFGTTEGRPSLCSGGTDSQLFAASGVQMARVDPTLIQQTLMTTFALGKCLRYSSLHPGYRD